MKGTSSSSDGPVEYGWSWGWIFTRASQMAKNKLPWKITLIWNFILFIWCFGKKIVHLASNSNEVTHLNVSPLCLYHFFFIFFIFTNFNNIFVCFLHLLHVKFCYSHSLLVMNTIWCCYRRCCCYCWWFSWPSNKLNIVGWRNTLKGERSRLRTYNISYIDDWRLLKVGAFIFFNPFWTLWSLSLWF